MEINLDQLINSTTLEPPLTPSVSTSHPLDPLSPDPSLLLHHHLRLSTPDLILLLLDRLPLPDTPHILEPLTNLHHHPPPNTGTTPSLRLQPPRSHGLIPTTTHHDRDHHVLILPPRRHHRLPPTRDLLRPHGVPTTHPHHLSPHHLNPHHRVNRVFVSSSQFHPSALQTSSNRLITQSKIAAV